jgi:hypothetical protein
MCWHGACARSGDRGLAANGIFSRTATINRFSPPQTQTDTDSSTALPPRDRFAFGVLQHEQVEVSSSPSNQRPVDRSTSRSTNILWYSCHTPYHAYGGYFGTVDGISSTIVRVVRSRVSHGVFPDRTTNRRWTQLPSREVASKGLSLSHVAICSA